MTTINMEDSINYYENDMRIYRNQAGQYELPIIHLKNELSDKNNIERQMYISSSDQQLHGDGYESISTSFGENICETRGGAQNIANIYKDPIYDNNIGQYKIVFSKLNIP